jgi:SpoIID/LytB domain protein
VTKQAWRRLSPLTAGLLIAGLALVPLTGLAQATPLATQTRHEIYPVPPGGVYTIHGRGNGNAHGLSQWGAYGAAKAAHLSTNQILHFYYPHTTLATKSTGRIIRVLLSAADTAGKGYLQLKPALGLTVTHFGGKPIVLPTVSPADHKTITGWRLQRSGSTVVLRYQAKSWHTYRTLGSGARITDTAAQVPVVTPNGDVSYRGTILGELESGTLEAVNDVNIELYLLSVVPDEMPSPWPAAALQAQAVAARTYARHGLNDPKASWYDVDGDTRDQAYGGVGAEKPRTTRAVQATAGEVIVDAAGHAVFAQYGSADGGWTVSGGVSYLPAEADPYDGMIPNTDHAWTRSVAASTLTSAYPQLGTLTAIEITGRDGAGLWGGRVTTLKLLGSKADVDLTGPQLQGTLGFGSAWFRPVPLPAAPSKLVAKASAGTVTATWQAPHSIGGAAAVTGYTFTLSPGGHTEKLGKSVLTASVSKLAAGTYTVTVTAQSSAGTGPAATTTVKVT